MFLVIGLSTTVGEMNSANDMGHLNQTNCWLAAPLDMGGFFVEQSDSFTKTQNRSGFRSEVGRTSSVWATHPYGGVIRYG